ncbi:MAG: hypothetical protein QM664_15140, partial [Flavihumibacter sp.]
TSTNTKSLPAGTVEKPAKKYVSVILPGNPPAKSVSPPAARPAPAPSFTTTLPTPEKLSVNWSRQPRRSFRPYLAGAALLLGLLTGIYLFSRREPVPETAPPAITENQFASYASHAATFKNLQTVSALAFAVLKKDLAVQADNHRTSLFGGVKAPQITITNNSKAVIGDILLQVDYLAKDKAIVDAEILHIPLLPAGASQHIEAPSSRRAVAIQTRIVSVNGFKSAGPLE